MTRQVRGVCGRSHRRKTVMAGLQILTERDRTGFIEVSHVRKNPLWLTQHELTGMPACEEEIVEITGGAEPFRGAVPARSHGGNPAVEIIQPMRRLLEGLQRPISSRSLG